MSLRRAASPDVATVLFGERSLTLLRACWPLAVGPRVAARTEVIAFEAKSLIVRVPDARWRKILHRMRREILERLRDVAGARAPRSLGFTLATQPLPEPAATPLEPKAPPCVAPPPEVTAGAQAISDPELRVLFLEAAGRYLARGSSR